MPHRHSRRAFLAALPPGLAGIALGSSGLRWRRLGEHPDPRPGIDARDVIPEERLEGFGEQVRETFRMIREMPQIADGIHCYCGCAFRGNRSLLTCYHADGMARGCPICQGEARLAHRRWKEGQSLDDIRRAIDARYS